MSFFKRTVKHTRTRALKYTGTGAKAVKHTSTTAVKLIPELIGRFQKAIGADLGVLL